MKYIVFSFDDGRADTFLIAYPVMKAHGYSFTVNISSEYIEYPEKYTEGSFMGVSPMTIEQICELDRNGVEIALHGHRHSNDINDIVENIKHLKSWGISSLKYGFASPYSYLSKNNNDFILKCMNLGNVSYIRSGIQVRRKGFLYSALYFLQEMTRSKVLFYYLNKEQIQNILECEHFFVGVNITNQTTCKQIEYLISKMPEETAIILILHSIVEAKSEKTKDRWTWPKERLELLCSIIERNKSIKVCTNISLLA